MGLLLFPFGKKATHLITIHLQRGVFIEEAPAALVASSPVAGLSQSERLLRPGRTAVLANLKEQETATACRASSHTAPQASLPSSRVARDPWYCGHIPPPKWTVTAGGTGRKP